MFKLMKLENLSYRVFKKSAGVDTVVNELELPSTMEALGVSESELRVALDDMYAKDNNCADFGVSMRFAGQCGFIYSDNRVVKAKTTTSTEIIFEVLNKGNA